MKQKKSEDEVVGMVLKEYKNRKEKWNKIDSEVHYNHYGSRGVLDLVISNESIHNLIEVKGSVTSANEVIRQCKRHQEYFFKGSDYGRGPPKHCYDKGCRKRRWELAIYLNNENWEAVIDNLDYYRTLYDSGWEIWWYSEGSEEVEAIHPPIFHIDFQNPPEIKNKLCNETFGAAYSCEIERVVK